MSPIAKRDFNPNIKEREPSGTVGHVSVPLFRGLHPCAILRLHLGAPVNVPKFRSLGPQDDDPVLLDASHNKASERSAELRKRLSST
ncbi:unnamed protein product [Symbiodinium microadriaticum]|nr:unnamed protein product [Symbiodinium microadriaticum]CAE7915231.1 unnamed protein product [Symbiodinium sp. KB8]